jgi:tetratricopeptide (TPR) repeat protein
LARSKRESPANPDVFDTVLRIRSLFLRGMGPEEHARRKSLLEQAVKLDPTNVYVLTQLAYELERAQNDGIGDEAERARAARLLAEAEAINPTDINVLGMKAVHLFRQRRYDECVTAYRRLLDEYSNTDWGYYGTGLCQVQSGRPEDAIRNLQMALRLDPRSPMNYDKYGVLGNALLMAEHYQESITANERAFTLIRTSYTSLRAIYELRIAVAHERLGDIEQAHQALEQANRIWPYDTVRSHYPADLSSKFLIAFVTRYKETLRQLGQRDHAKEDADFDVPSDDNLREDYAGLTPNTVPGAKTIYTAELQRLLEKEQPIVIDPLLYSWGRSIPGAVGLSNAGSGGSIRDPKQERLRKKLTALTKGDHARPIVAVGWNSERFDGRNLALRLIALGYTDVYWYRGGREAWEAAGLPETDVAMQDW